MLLGDAAFETIAGMARSIFALNLDHSKKQMVSRRLAPRVREIGLHSFEDYVERLMNDDVERRTLLSTLTTNTTHFFREGHHFDMLRDGWLTRLMAHARSGGRVRFWSAACSAGQEPYSLAMTILEVCPEAASLDVHILATDIDPRILDVAQAGAYNAEDMDGVSLARQTQFMRATGHDRFRVRDEVKRLVSFGQLNLPAKWPFRGKFDVVFCRNVAIYFDQATQQQLWARIADRTLPGGLLCIGHSERIAAPEKIMLRPLGKTAYERE